MYVLLLPQDWHNGLTVLPWGDGDLGPILAVPDPEYFRIPGPELMIVSDHGTSPNRFLNRVVSSVVEDWSGQPHWTGNAVLSATGPDGDRRPFTPVELAVIIGYALWGADNA